MGEDDNQAHNGQYKKLKTLPNPCFHQLCASTLDLPTFADFLL